MFAAYLPGQGKEIARGGRYNDIGAAFGNPRPATGFSADLLTLYQLSAKAAPADGEAAILAPLNDDPALHDLVNELRQQGERVILDLSNGKMSTDSQHCNRVIEKTEQGWQVKSV